MEDIIYNDSPLAEYLEGAGQADVDWDDASYSDHDKDDPDRNAPADSRADFAPRGPPKTAKAFGSVLPQPLKVNMSGGGGVAGLLDAFARVVRAKPGAAENSRFIERFRYILAASQLLDENTSQASWPLHPASNDTAPSTSAGEFNIITPTGALTTGVAALALVWLVYWSRWNLRSNSLTKKKVLIIFLTVAIVAVGFYAYARRQLLHYLRHQAVTNGSALVTNLQSFDASSSNAIQHIQEVELVSRGYRLSTPMPPISRIEQTSVSKRCIRLRKSLERAYALALPVLSEACSKLQNTVDEDDLERYLDVYDVNNDDVREAAAGWREDEFDDLESIKAFRVHQFRFVTLRRLFLCSLISLEADGSNADYSRWRTAGETMQKLAASVGDSAEKINSILTEEESFDSRLAPSANTADLHSRTNSASAGTTTPTRERLRKQLRSLATLSTGIRSIQAKMQVLREDSQSILSSRSSKPTSPERTEDEVHDDDLQLQELGTSLLTHYDAIGTDLKSLVQAWESGRTGLALSLDRAERRISRASGVSSGPRSPTFSLGGLTAVDEMPRGGSPFDALAALEGDSPASPERGRMDLKAPPSPRLRVSTSTDTSEFATDSVSGSRSSPGSCAEEVFEGIAAPRPPRSLGTPQERAARLVEERRRRESRQVGAQMIQELEAVLSRSGGPGNDSSQSSSVRSYSCRSSAMTSPVSAVNGEGRRGSAMIPPGLISGDRRGGGQPAATGLQSSNANGQRDAAVGRRRPFSMYSIGPQPQQKGQRVTSL